MDDNSIVDQYRRASRLRDAPPPPDGDKTNQAPHPYYAALDSLAPMRTELERRETARRQRVDPNYVPDTTTNSRWARHLRATKVMSRYIRRFMGITNPDDRRDE